MGKMCINHLNGDQYATFLYFLANNIFNDMGSSLVCNNVISTEQADARAGLILWGRPDIFLFISGYCLGARRIRDCFVVYQRCGVGVTTNL